MLTSNLWRGHLIKALLIGIAAVNPPIVTAAPILGSHSSENGLFTADPFTSFSLRIFVGPPATGCYVLGNCAQIALFEGINESAVGTVVTLDASALDFFAVAGTLSNGFLDDVGSGMIPGPLYNSTAFGGQGFIESAFGTNPDFFGQTISSVSVRLDSISISDGPVPFPFPIPFPPEDGYLAQVTYTVTVYGAEVPEPSTWFLLLAGVAVIGGVGKARRGSFRS